MRVFAGAVCAMLGCSDARGASCRWTGASAPDAAPVSFECRAALFGTSVSSLAFDAPLALAVPPDACSEAVTCKGGCQGKVVLAVRGKCPFYQKALAVMRASEGKAVALIIADSEPPVPGKPLPLLIRGQAAADPLEEAHSIPVFSTLQQHFETLRQGLASQGPGSGAVRVAFGDSQTCAGGTETCAAPSSFARLGDWLRAAQAGAAAEPAVRFGEQGGTAARRIEAGEVALRVSKSRVLSFPGCAPSLSTAANAALGKVAEATTDVIALAVLLMFLRDPRNGQHVLAQKFEPFLSTLPQTSTWCLPQWTDAEVAELQGTGASDITSAKARQALEWKLVGEATDGRFFADEGYFSQANYAHCRCLVNQRAFGSSAGAVLLPGTDLLPPGSRKLSLNPPFETAEGDLVSIANWPIEEGAAVSTWMGDVTNKLSMDLYGRASPGYISQFEMQVPLAGMVTNPAYASHLSVLAANLGPLPAESQAYAFAINSSSIANCGCPGALLETIRLLLGSAPDPLAAGAGGFQRPFQRKPASLQVEYNVAASIVSNLQSELAAHGTTIAEDEALVGGGGGGAGLSQNALAAVQFRLGVKRLKQATVGHLEAVQALIREAAETDTASSGTDAGTPAVLAAKLLGCVGDGSVKECCGFQTQSQDGWAQDCFALEENQCKAGGFYIEIGVPRALILTLTPGPDPLPTAGARRQEGLEHVQHGHRAGLEGALCRSGHAQHGGPNVHADPQGDRGHRRRGADGLQHGRLRAGRPDRECDRRSGEPDVEREGEADAGEEGGRCGRGDAAGGRRRAQGSGLYEPGRRGPRTGDLTELPARDPLRAHADRGGERGSGPGGEGEGRAGVPRVRIHGSPGRGPLLPPGLRIIITNQTIWRIIIGLSVRCERLCRACAWGVVWFCCVH
jgi:hypothetical protein